MEGMTGTQSIIYDELNRLLDMVEDGKFGKGNNFNKYTFEAAFDDEVLIYAYVYDGEI